jgi:hypothetical protein
MGGDIGGSIRNFALLLLIVGFMDSSPLEAELGKWALKALLRAKKGTKSHLKHSLQATILTNSRIIATQGPMSTSRTALNLFKETYLATEPWIKEDYLFPIP